MNLSVIFAIGAFALLAALAALGAAFITRSRRSRRQTATDRAGAEGERLVADALGKDREGVQRTVNDLIISDGEGKSCQIDHVFINRFGVWVIETKNYAGKIYGSDDAQMWTQYLDGGKIKNDFYNPVKQNNTHIYRLSELLKAKDVFHNVVIFTGTADLANVRSANVFYLEALQRVINYDAGVCLTPQLIEAYYGILRDCKANCQIGLDEHIENVRRMREDVERGICPRCGGKLVVRHGKNGDFYGCSNFPKCKFSKNL